MDKFTVEGTQLDIMLNRYTLPAEKTWEDVSKRVSSYLAKAENNGDIMLWEKRFFWVMSNGYYFPGGRVLHGAGRRADGLLNCFCKGVSDNRHSIARLMHDVYLITTFGGGVGTNYSSIRPKGDSMQGVPGIAPGVVSEMQKIDTIGGKTKTRGGRKAALIASLDVGHPDFLEFLDVKLDLHELNNHNISVNYNKKFFDAVKNDEEWKFEFRGQQYNRYRLNRIIKGGSKEEIFVVSTNEANVIKKAENFYKLNWDDTFEIIGIENMMAKDIWSRVCKNAVKSGEPGFLFIDNIKKNFATWYFEEYCNVNPCTESVLPDDGNCNLGSINLSLMYCAETNDVDWKLLSKTIKIAVRMLDNVLTMNMYPTPETKVVAEKSRRIGLGVMGLHHLLISMGIRYGSEESLEFIEKLFAHIRNEAFKSSIEIAKEKGSFPEFNYEKFIDNEYIKRLPTRILKSIQNFGIRNAVILSIAPTGTISMVAGTSSGIEPIFSPMYKRKYRVDNVIKESVVVDSMFSRFVNSGKKWDHIVGAYDITPEEHIAVQAAVQDYTDQAISKCVVEGTMLNTNMGAFKIEDIAGYECRPGCYVEPFNKNIKILDKNGDEKKINSVYNGGEKDCVSIRFSNGKEIECSENHKFLTTGGWRKFSELVVGDRVFYNTTSISCNNEYQKMPAPLFSGKCSIKYEYPELCDENFARFFGMWLADGYANKNSIGIVEKNQMVGDIIDDLFLVNFGVRPKIVVDKRNGVSSHSINSREISRHFKDNFGANCVTKFIPDFIFKSSDFVKKAFLEGLTLDGYKIDLPGKLVIYEGYSKSIVDGAATICSSLGYRYYINKKNVKNGLLSKTAHGIHIYYNGCDLIPIEKHKIPVNASNFIQRYVPIEDRTKIEEFINNGPNKVYTRRNFKRSMHLCDGFMDERSLLRFGYKDFNEHVGCVKITHMKKIGKRNVWDISVEGTHSYNIDGIICHNTINVPEGYDYHDLMNLIFRYSDSIKGLTIYREGSRENEPLRAIPTTKANVEKYAKKEELAGVANQECNTGTCEF